MSRTLKVMEETHLAAVALTALEIMPGEPSDLSPLLRCASTRAALESLSADDGTDELAAWLCEEIDYPRVETWQKRIEQVQRDLDAHVVMAHSAEYPSQLSKCWDAPPVLFVRGSFARSCSVGIVGSRSASPDELEVAAELAGSAARAGYSIVSGLAAGVDAAAHRGALAQSGHTVAVTGTGIRRVFPAHHRELTEAIIDAGGAVVSQFAPNAPRTPTTFLRRNSVIAGLADLDVVVAGHERSGSRHQADQAIRYGRPLLMWRASLARERWARELADLGAATFIDDPSDMLRLMPASAHGVS